MKNIRVWDPVTEDLAMFLLLQKNNHVFCHMIPYSKAFHHSDHKFYTQKNRKSVFDFSKNWYWKK